MSFSDSEAHGAEHKFFRQTTHDRKLLYLCSCFFPEDFFFLKTIRNQFNFQILSVEIKKSCIVVNLWKMLVWFSIWMNDFWEINSFSLILGTWYTNLLM